MSIEDILREKAEQAGWNDTSVIAMLCRYIDNQQDDACFEDFVARAVEEEQAMTDEVTYSIRPGSVEDFQPSDEGWIITKTTTDGLDTRDDEVAFVQTETMARLYVHACGQPLPDGPKERGVQRAELSPKQRAECATAALAAYNLRPNTCGATAEDELEDLLADILHLLGERTLAARILRRAIRDYERERGETIITAVLTPE